MKYPGDRRLHEPPRFSGRGGGSEGLHAVKAVKDLLSGKSRGGQRNYEKVKTDHSPSQNTQMSLIANERLRYAKRKRKKKKRHLRGSMRNPVIRNVNRQPVAKTRPVYEGIERKPLSARKQEGEKERHISKIFWMRTSHAESEFFTKGFMS